MVKKQYLVVAAQKEEIDGLFAFVKPLDCGDNTYVYEGENYTIHAMIGGIGKVAMAYRLGKFLAHIRADEIFNIGVAGSISKKLAPMDILLADRCAYNDADLTAFGYPIGQMSGEPLYFTCDKKGIALGLKEKDPTVKTGLILSGDSFITNKNLPSSFFENYDNPVAVDMESAAVGQVAHDEEIPFMIIRAISDDTTKDDNKDAYDRRLKSAAVKAGKLVYQIINKMPETK